MSNQARAEIIPGFIRTDVRTQEYNKAKPLEPIKPDNKFLGTLFVYTSTDEGNTLLRIRGVDVGLSAYESRKLYEAMQDVFNKELIPIVGVSADEETAHY